MRDAVQSRRVWDLPTRLLHWLLAVLFVFSWWSAETRRMDWHQRSGLAICGLIVFRLLWGLFGSSTAQFAQFVRGPRAVWSHLRTAGGGDLVLGHNPLGGWSVVVLLVVLVFQVVTGTIAVDIDGIESGPLSYLVNFDQGRVAAALHEQSFNVLLLLVGLHIAAVLFYLGVRRRNLIAAMITGRQGMAMGRGAATMTPAPWWRAVLALLVSMVFAWALAGGFRI